MEASIASNDFCIIFTYWDDDLLSWRFFLVILIFGLTEFNLLMILLIFTIFLGDVVENMSLM